MKIPFIFTISVQGYKKKSIISSGDVFADTPFINMFFTKTKYWIAQGVCRFRHGIIEHASAFRYSIYNGCLDNIKQGLRGWSGVIITDIKNVIREHQGICRDSGGVSKKICRNIGGQHVEEFVFLLEEGLIWGLDTVGSNNARLELNLNDTL